MARISREFLVPYLQNLCSLYIADEKIKNKIRNLENRIYHVTKGVEKECWPACADQISVVNGTVVFCFFAAAFFGLGIFSAIALMAEVESIPWLILFFSVPMFLFFLIGGISKIRANQEYNREEEQRYKHGINRCYAAREHNEQVRQKELPGLQTELQEAQAELEKVNNVMRQVYAANIIPLKYREFYAIVYLYDWFVHGASDNLDMALNTFVLEEIKDQLDRIIENQSEIILNQCRQMALQQQTLKAQEEHNEIMIRKIDQIIESNDQRNMYLDMIECNTAATAYFAAADYLNKI